jgi:micrococcal nuclease
VKVLSQRKITSAIISVCLLLIVSFLQQKGYLNLENSSSEKGHTPRTQLTPKVLIQSDVAGASESAFLVTRVVDGDTIKLENGQTVRYIGIDTPETKDPRRPVGCFGQEASNKNKELVEGKRVRLEKDVSETDKYGRLLRYVYVSSSSTSSGKEELFVNDYLVKEGYAHASSYPPDVVKQSVFNASETDARNHNRGLWNSCK